MCFYVFLSFPYEYNNDLQQFFLCFKHGNLCYYTTYFGRYVPEQCVCLFDLLLNVASIIWDFYPALRRHAEHAFKVNK